MSRIDITDAVMSMMRRESHDYKPVCLLNNEPELEERLAFHRKRCDDFNARREALEQEYQEYKGQFWEGFEGVLMEKGLMTQAEKDREIGLVIRDGVLFKYECEHS